MRVVGHRGALALAPENTITSFARAEACGVDEVEFDVQRTADGVPVLLHDETLDRTTSGTGALHARTWDEVRRLDAGAKFAAEYAGERLPSLGDLCAWIAPRRLGLSCELKQPWPASGLPADEGLAEAALAVLREHALLTRTVIHSFDHPTIARVLTLEPSAVTALLSYGPTLVDPLALVRAIPGVAGLHVRWSFVSRDLVSAAHAEGMHVHGWGLPEPLDRNLVLRLVEFGVDSLSANAPDGLVALLAREGLR